MSWHLRVFRRVRVLPGVSVNLSKSGPSLTLGVRGAHITFGQRRITRTVGVPGSGIYFTSREGYHSGVHAQGRAGHLLLIAIVLALLWALSR
jgi:hypothetical protein